MAACAIFSFARFFTPVTGCTLYITDGSQYKSPLTDLHPSKVRTVISDHLSLTRAKSVRGDSLSPSQVALSGVVNSAVNSVKIPTTICLQVEQVGV
uniref:Uncharacterized protein n=1 Tax=Oryza nivara TaxID=4536 RepID=A0A0E0I0D7_ORYNI